VEARESSGPATETEVNPEFKSIFRRLRAMLQKHAGAALSVKTDTPECYCLEAAAGPAAVRAWGGKLKRPTIPVAWVQIEKAYVSFHNMCVYGNGKLRDSMSKELKARMHGKTCFNFKNHDEGLFEELKGLTAKSLAAFRKAGFIAGSAADGN
jgi:hypothetical protein